MWGATVYLPPNTEFEYKFIQEDNGNVWDSLARAHHLADHVGFEDRVGIRSKPAGHDACVRSAVDCDDKLALIGMMMIVYLVGYPLPSLLYSHLSLDILCSAADLYCIVDTGNEMLFVVKSGDNAHNNVLKYG